MEESVYRIEQFLLNPETVILCNNYREHRTFQFDDDFNFFKIISDNYHKENLHSDILGFLLDPKGSHKMDRVFLDLFLKFIKERLNIDFDFTEFDEKLLEEVTREIERMDVCIRGKNEVILIENKINTLSDTDGQIPTYVQRIYNSGKKVVTILYCTLTVPKQPERKGWDKFSNRSVIKDIDDKHLIQSVCFYNRTNTDLCSGWIDECIQKSEGDIRTFLIHYRKTLKSLGEQKMTTTELDEFYRMVLDKDKFDIIHSIRELYEDLPEFRRQRLLNLYGGQECKPFDTFFPYSRFLIFETRSIYKGHRIKLSITVEPSEYIIEFFDNDRSGDETSVPCSQMLQILGLSDKFVTDEENVDYYIRTFQFPSQEMEMENFLNTFIDKFKTSYGEIVKVLSVI